MLSFKIALILQMTTRLSHRAVRYIDVGSLQGGRGETETAGVCSDGESRRKTEKS